MENHADVMIAGGGPVGLYLAGRLLQNGISCLLLEKKKEISHRSKSLGIHPVSLELFFQAGIADAFIEQGVKIKKGIAFWNRNRIGEISFSRCPGPFSFVLSLPQWQTETIIENWVQYLNPASIIRGTKITNLNQTADSVSVTYTQGNHEYTVQTGLLIGCDGKNSIVRKHAGIPFMGNPYPDTYIMGDYTESTAFGPDAAIYLHQDGLIESFPLPGNFRRWVAKTDSLIENPQPEHLQNIIEQRIGHSLSSAQNAMISSFGVQHYLADRYYAGRVVLAGDSAHVISPIGGQGMNLGWLDAEACAQIISDAIAQKSDPSALLEKYSSKQKKMAAHAAKRAELNMWLGRKENSGPLVKAAVHLITKKPLSHLLARIFTMRGLGRWWV